MCANKAFTLIEMIVAIVIMVILAIIAVTVANISGKDVDSVAKVMRSNIQFAQDLAMTHGSTYGFRTTSGTNYEIYDGAPGSPATDPLTGGNMLYNIAPVQFFGGLQPQVIFQPDGKAQVINGADQNIRITDGSQQRYIQVEPNTGFVWLKTTP